MGDLDDTIQREIDEALGGRSIEELLDEVAPAGGPRAPAAGQVAPGQVCSGRVVAVESQGILVELGGKDQGVVPLEQFEEAPAVGEVVELEVLRYDDGEDLWMLSRQGAVQRVSWDHLAEGQIVDGFVDKSNKGGLEVSFGGVHAFMPVSQISIYRVEEPGDYVGQKLRCQVVEVDRRDRRVIVSARAVMELEAEKAREKLLAELAEGDVREGIVRQVMPYGAFVDLGGVDGLLHVSEMSYARVKDPGEIVQAGEKINVKVLKIDRDNNRISLGMKQVAPDPWDTVEQKYPAGFLATGTITNLTDFGAFCQVEPGVEGLIPISEITWSRRLRHPSEELTVGQTVQAVVLQVEPDRRRMSLSVKEAGSNPWAGATQRFAAGSEVIGRVSRIEDYGAFVELEPGVEGLAHISELSYERVNRVEDVLQADQQVRVRVLEVDEPARRIALSVKGVLQPGQEQAEAPPKGTKKQRTRPLRGGLD